MLCMRADRRTDGYMEYGWNLISPHLSGSRIPFFTKTRTELLNGIYFHNYINRLTQFLGYFLLVSDRFSFNAVGGL